MNYINKYTAAYILSMTVYMFEKHVKNGVFKGKKFGIRYFYSTTEIDKFIANREKVLNKDKGGVE